MRRRLQEKREFYRRSDVADSYDEQRFGGASGQRVNQRELDIVLEMLPTNAHVLDLACGTGRLTRALMDHGRVTALDASPAMAEKTASLGAATVVGDAFQTPFADHTFDAVAAVRFAFHFADLGPLLSEMSRLVVPGGILILDTYSWSPRSALALGSNRWGGKVHPHGRNEVAALATHLGLHVDRVEPCFLFSPYLYRLAPLPLERAFEALEERVPPSWLCRVFWKLRSPA
jgi:SAM-dependent methyltransferase